MPLVVMKNLLRIRMHLGGLKFKPMVWGSLIFLVSFFIRSSMKIKSQFWSETRVHICWYD